jgi:PAS domain-containing protein
MIRSILPAVVITLFIVMGTSIFMSFRAQEKNAYITTMEAVRNYSVRFNGDMASTLAIAEMIKTTLEQTRHLDREEVMNILHHLLIQNPHLLGTYVGYETGAFDGLDANYANSPGHDATGRFLPYWNRLRGAENLDPILNIDASDFYTLPKTTGKDVILEPYIYEGVLMTSFVCPMFKKGKFAGIGGVDLSLDYLDHTISRIKVLETGYAYLISKKGFFLSFPDKSFIGRKTLSRYAEETGNDVLATISKSLDNGKEGYLSGKDPVSGKSVVVFFTPIPACHWGMVIVVPTKEILADTLRLAMVMLVIGFVAIFMIAGVVTAIAGSLSQPIVELAEKADGIAAGDLDIHLQEQDGEIGILARSFTNMAAQLRRKFKEIRESEARFRSLFKFAPLPLASSSADGRIDDVNDRFIQVLGYTCDDIPDLDNWWSAAYPDPEYRQEVDRKSVV